MIRNIIWSENQNQFRQSPLYQPPLVRLASSHLTSDFLCVGAVFPETSACIVQAAGHPEAEWWGVPRPSAPGWGPAEKHSSTGETVLRRSARPQNVRGVKEPFLLTLFHSGELPPAGSLPSTFRPPGLTPASWCHFP